MKLAPKHVVTIVVSVCAAVVLAPVGVMAATGSLVNITDPVDASRKARVNPDGTLRVEARSLAGSGTFNKTSGDLAFAGSSAALVTATSPTRIAVTELSVSADTYITANNPQYTARVEIYQLTRTSGTAACAMSASGWTQQLLRYVSVASGQTVDLTFGGSPMVLSAPTGQVSCLLAFVRVMPTNGHVFVGATGYTYTG
jgi:hypothetical protein